MQSKFEQFLNFVRPSDHSKYSPSSADRWLKTGCPASINLCKDIPPGETSKYAEEGTMAHELCEHFVRESFMGLPVPNDMHLMLAMLPDQGEEMTICAQQYVDVVSYWLSPEAGLGDIVWWGLEKGVPVFPELGCFGTADCLVVGTKGAAVIDFKYGRGKNVSADTLQLKVYAAGLAKHIDIPKDHMYPITAVVHQPRTDADAKEYTYRFDELIDFLDVIHESILIAERGDTQPVEGNHCFWCPANRTRDLNLKCPIKREKPLKLAQENFDKFMADSQKMPETDELKARRDAAIIKLMSLMPAIEHIVTQGQDEFMHRINQGEHIEGVRIVDKQGRRKINAENDADAKALLMQHFPNVNPVEIIPAKEKIRTITSLEKELGRGKLEPICVRPIKKEIEVLDDKKREILNSMTNYAKQIGGAV